MSRIRRVRIDFTQLLFGKEKESYTQNVDSTGIPVRSTTQTRGIVLRCHGQGDLSVGLHCDGDVTVWHVDDSDFRLALFASFVRCFSVR